MALGIDEFLRRFLLHVLPRGFVRIRHFGLLANRQRCALIARARQLLGTPPPTASSDDSRSADADRTRCPFCGQGPWHVEILPPCRPPSCRSHPIPLDVMTTVNRSSLSSTAVVTHAPALVCLDRRVRVGGQRRVHLDHGAPDVCVGFLPCRCAPSLTKTDDHPALSALESP